MTCPLASRRSISWVKTRVATHSICHANINLTKRISSA
jgi:hypothetical protein